MENDFDEIKNNLMSQKVQKLFQDLIEWGWPEDVWFHVDKVNKEYAKNNTYFGLANVFFHVVKRRPKVIRTSHCLGIKYT